LSIQKDIMCKYCFKRPEAHITAFFDLGVGFMSKRKILKYNALWRAKPLMEKFIGTIESNHLVDGCFLFCRKK